MGRAMKDSGVEWIGEIPEAWNVFPMKSVIISNDSGIWGNDPVGDGTDKVVIRSTEQSIDGKWQITSPATRNLSGFNVDTYRILPGDLLITKSSGSAFHIGKTTIADQYFAEKECYYSNFIQRVRVNQFAKYYWYILNSTIARDQFVYLQNTTSGIGNINAKDIEKIYVPLPSIDEQYSISRFLDEQCAKIDTIIAKALASIEEYKHLKQAVITQTVTKGVRGERPMKDSGIAWIGKVPENWDIINLGKHISIESGISVGKNYETGTALVEVPYLRVANVQGDHVDFSDIATIFVTPEEAEKYKLRAGQMLMTEGGDRDKLGRGCKWNGEIENCIHQNHVFAVQTDDDLLTDYLDYLTTSDVARTYFDVTAKKTTNLACTNKATIQRFTIPVPPVDEQREICAFLDDKCAKLNSLIFQKEQLLTELESYKKSMIYEYVTGKKEV